MRFLISTLVCLAPATAVPFWPLPSSHSQGSSVVAVVPGVDFFPKDSCDTLTQAYRRYSDLTFPHPAGTVSSEGAVTSLDVMVDDDDESYPQLGTDESYSLTVPAEGGAATISAATVYGALRGLETFSQLVGFDFESASYVVEGAPWRVDDAPRFPHRGLMLDSARHFLPVAKVRAAIDSLAYAKLNVLHW